jgi:hypothetical protein
VKTRIATTEASGHTLPAQGFIKRVKLAESFVAQIGVAQKSVAPTLINIKQHRTTTTTCC